MTRKKEEALFFETYQTRSERATRKQNETIVIQQVKHSNPNHSLETLEPACKRQPGSFFDSLSCTETVCDTQSRENKQGGQTGRQSLFSPQLPEVFDNKQKRGGWGGGW